jgi:hypothetical protein
MREGDKGRKRGDEISKVEPATVQSGLEVFDSRRVVTKLADLMDGVTAKEITADNVRAACECSARITDIMRLHLEAGRLKAKLRPT